MFVLMFGHHEEEQVRNDVAGMQYLLLNAGISLLLATCPFLSFCAVLQHGFLAGELMIQFENNPDEDGEESDEDM